MVIYAEDRGCTTQFELGEMFAHGGNGMRDYRQAHRWYKNAAINGSRQAQHRLAAMYARGQGVAQDYAKAYAWCKVAVFQNSRRARRKLACIEAKMSFQQLRRGRWLAQDYYDRFVTHRIK
ncbi:MAG: sel1 repeat family protein [Gammaproteobacteria bacterium]|nr:MAG: sel1 repeat family protein [Gammaproteobacteria bacterium]UCH39716.1 MAG: sel1 repeat family protein [Gammaproteobacteria bacterium]